MFSPFHCSVLTVALVLVILFWRSFSDILNYVRSCDTSLS
jgi:hypothetical protein